MTLTFGGTAVLPRIAAAYPAAFQALSVDEADQEFVLWLAQYDEQAMVRSTAWNALLSTDVPTALQRFFETEWEYAELLAAGSRARNRDFVAYVVSSCVPTYSPEVCAAAQRASRGSDVDRDAFVRTGYGEAKQRDKQARDAAGQKAAALIEADRASVVALRDRDPGAQVRAAAAWALRSGATDEDLVEFFAYGWGHAAGLDVRAHRTQLADGEAAWRRTTKQLIADARAAEQAARAAAAEASEQARAAAARAWAAVADNTGPARVAWQEAEQVALTQAEVWRRVAATAAGTINPNWTPIAGTADSMGGHWAVELEQSQVQAAYWVDLYEQALAAEHAWSLTNG